MLQELITLYERPAALSPVPAVTFRAYQQAVDRFRATPGHAERVGYWKRRFESLPAGPALPKLPGNGAAAAVGHQRISGVLDKWSALRDCAKARGLEPGMILLTAYLEVLYAWNDQQPLAVVVPGWERLPAHPDMDRVVGDFTALTWAARWPEAMSFELRLQQVCRQHADDLAQRPVSGLQALRRLLLKEGRRQSRYPVVFTNHISRQELPGRNFELGRSISRTPQVCLDNISSEVGCRLHCNWDFDGEIYAEDMIAEMFDGYLRLLELLASNEQAWRRIDFGNLIRARPSAYTTNESRGVSCRGSGWNACATKTGERKSLEGRRTLS